MQRDLWLAVFLLAVVIGAGWFWWQSQQPEPAPATTVAPAEPPVEIEAFKPEPTYVVPSPVESGELPLVSLPDLSDSDAYFLLELSEPFGSGLDALLVTDGLIERFVATVDNLPRRKLADSIRPLVPVPGNLQVEDDRLATANTERYDDYVERFMSADIDTLVLLYRRFYPLLQEAYERLGYPDGYFNDRLIEVIDHLLALSDIPSEPELTRPHVLYQFADEDLEASSVGHKLLLRLGPENAARIQSRLAELKDRLTQL